MFTIHVRWVSYENNWRRATRGDICSARGPENTLWREDHDVLHTNIFYTNWDFEGWVRNMIIDDGSCEKMLAQDAIDNLERKAKKTIETSKFVYTCAVPKGQPSNGFQHSSYFIFYLAKMLRWGLVWSYSTYEWRKKWKERWRTHCFILNRHNSFGL